jgi:hypothetical protein
LEKDDYDTITVSINVEKGTTTNQMFEMPKNAINLTFLVTDLEGNRLSEVSVRTISRPDGQASLTDKTVNGELRFSGIKPGDYIFESSLSGYQTTSESITLIDEDITLEMYLESIRGAEDEGNNGRIPGYQPSFIILSLIFLVFFYKNTKQKT